MGTSDSSDNRLIFNKSRLNSIAPPSTGRAVYHDQKVRGLCLQVTAKGTKTFYLYKWFEGKPLKHKIGRFPATTVETARKRTAALLAGMAEGKNPQVERRAARGEMILDELLARWLADAKLRKKTWPEDERQYKQVPQAVGQA